MAAIALDRWLYEALHASWGRLSAGPPAVPPGGLPGREDTSPWPVARPAAPRTGAARRAALAA